MGQTASLGLYINIGSKTVFMVRFHLMVGNYRVRVPMFV